MDFLWWLQTKRSPLSWPPCKTHESKTRLHLGPVLTDKYSSKRQWQLDALGFPTEFEPQLITLQFKINQPDVRINFTPQIYINSRENVEIIDVNLTSM